MQKKRAYEKRHSIKRRLLIKKTQRDVEIKKNMYNVKFFEDSFSYATRPFKPEMKQKNENRNIQTHSYTKHWNISFFGDVLCGVAIADFIHLLPQCSHNNTCMYYVQIHAIRFCLYFMCKNHENGVWWRAEQCLYNSIWHNKWKEKDIQTHTRTHLSKCILVYNKTKIIAWTRKKRERARERRGVWGVLYTAQSRLDGWRMAEEIRACESTFPKRTGSFARVHWHFCIRGRRKDHI